MEFVEPVNLPISPDSIKEEDWVFVKFEKCLWARLFVLRVMKSRLDVSVTIWYLCNHMIHEPQKFEREEDAIFYK